jgi:hypothetical protein
VPSKGPLGNLSIPSPVKRNTQVFQLINGSRGILGENFDGVLITQIIATLDRVKHVPFPTILFFVAERRANATLSSPGMGTGGKDFTDNSNIYALIHFNGSAESGQSGANNDHVVLMLHNEPLVSSEPPDSCPLAASCRLAQGSKRVLYSKYLAW